MTDFKPEIDLNSDTCKAIQSRIDKMVDNHTKSLIKVQSEVETTFTRGSIAALRELKQYIEGANLNVSIEMKRNY